MNTTSDNYYAVNLQGLGEFYEYAENALEAIQKVRHDYQGNTKGSATARKAVYGEWDCGLEHYRLDGSHSHDWVNA